METITETTLLQAATAAGPGAEQVPEVKEAVEVTQEVTSGGSPARVSSHGEQRLSQGQPLCFSTLCML